MSKTRKPAPTAAAAKPAPAAPQPRLVTAEIGTRNGLSGATAYVIATLTWADASPQAALAEAFTLAATLLRSLPGVGGWTMPQVEERWAPKGYAAATLTYELCHQTAEELERILALFHDVIPSPA